MTYLDIPRAYVGRVNVVGDCYVFGAALQGVEPVYLDVAGSATSVDKRDADFRHLRGVICDGLHVKRFHPVLVTSFAPTPPQLLVLRVCQFPLERRRLSELPPHPNGLMPV